MHSFSWEENWHQVGRLNEAMSRLYNISIWTNYFIHFFKVLRQTQPQSRWKRELRAWESEVEYQLNLIIQEIELSSRKDSLLCCYNDDIFITRQWYQLIEDFDNNNEGNWIKFWKMKVPPKSAYFYMENRKHNFTFF